MPRARQYASAAEKQAAYRARENLKLDRIFGALYRLENAIWEASYRGDDLALRCRATQLATMLDRLADAFEQSCPQS